MLKVTSQRLLDKIGTGIDEVGRPVLIGAPVDGNLVAGGITVLRTIPKGSVVLVTKVLCQGHGAAGLTGLLGTKDSLWGSPNSAYTIGYDFEQTAGTSENAIRFQFWARYNSLFGAAASPTWRTAPPSNVVQWNPKYPLVVPSEWTAAASSTTVGEWDGNLGLYGILVTEDDARMLGFRVSGTATNNQRSYGFVASLGTGGTETLVTGRTGKSIRILDIHVRSQPALNSLNTVTLLQSTDSRAFFKLHNSNPAEMIEKQFSPDIYLKAGDSLQMTTTVSGRCSVNISYEFVDADEVPGDHWWGCVDPSIGTPAEGTTGVGSAYTEKTNDITLYYPRKDDLGVTATATTPGIGRQHLLRGYVISAQKDACRGGTSDDIDQQVIGIVDATTDSTNVAFGHSSATAVNISGDISMSDMMSPMFVIGAHDQNLAVVVDNLNLPCRKDTGKLRVDVIGMSAGPNVLISALTPANGDMTAWSVCVWGRTIPTQMRNPRRRSF